MKRISIALAALSLSAAAMAQVSITEAWVRGTVPQQKATGVFMNIDAEQDLRLIGGESPVAGKVEVHDMVLKGDVMQMRHLPDGLDIAKGRTMHLKPGSYHIMLMELRQTLKGGDTVPLTLHFQSQDGQNSFSQEIQAPVKALGSGHAAPAAHKH